MLSLAPLLALMLQREGGVAGCTLASPVRFGHSATLAIGIPGIVFATFITGHSVFFHQEFLPSRTRLAQVDPKLSMALWAFELVVPFLDILEPTHSAIHYFILVVLAALLTALHAVLLPYYRGVVNKLWVSVLAGTTWSILFAFIIHIAPATQSARIAVSSIGLVGTIPVSIIAWFAVSARLRSFAKKLENEAASPNKIYQIELASRQCFSSKASDDLTSATKATRVIAKGLEMFPESSELRLALGIVMLEKLTDPRGMLVHVRAAKRLNHTFFVGLQLNYLVQLSLDRSRTEAKTKEIDDALEIVLRLQKAARRDSARFWTVLSKVPRGGSFDTPEVFALTRGIDTNVKKVQEIMLALLQRYPTQPRILRAYARFCDEMLNDAEVSGRVLQLADAAEDYAAKKRKHAHGDSKPPQQVAVEVVECNPREDHFGQGRRDEDDETSVAVSNAQASSTSTSSEARLRSRFFRRSIDTTRVGSVSQALFGVVAIVLIIFACAVAEFIVAKSFLERFRTTTDQLNYTIRMKSSICRGLYFLREREYKTLANLTTDPTFLLSTIRTRSIVLNEAFVMAFKEMMFSEQMHKHWASGFQIEVFSPGPTPGTGVTTRQTLGLYDLGCAVTNAINMLGDEQLMSQHHPQQYRDDPFFRYLFANAPTLGDALVEMNKLFVDAIVIEKDNIDAIILTMFLVAIGIAIFASGILLVWLWRLSKERTRAASLFTHISKSAVANVLDKLHADEILQDSAEVTSARSSGSFSSMAVLIVKLAIAVVLGLAYVGVLFGLARQFTAANKPVVVYLRYAGMRRNLLSEAYMWAQETIVADESVMTLNATLAKAENILQQLVQTDQDLKYGNVELGIESIIKQNLNVINELWYERECPAEFGLNDCRGLSLLFRYCVDELTQFLGATDATRTFSNTHFVNGARVFDTTSDWLLEDVGMVVDILDASLNRLLQISEIIVAIASVISLATSALLCAQVHSLGNESSRLVKMLLQIPMSVLEKTEEIKDFIENGDDTFEIKVDHQKAQNS
jgi:hypothetical protein